MPIQAGSGRRTTLPHLECQTRLPPCEEMASRCESSKFLFSLVLVTVPASRRDGCGVPIRWPSECSLRGRAEKLTVACTFALRTPTYSGYFGVHVGAFQREVTAQRMSNQSEVSHVICLHRYMRPSRQTGHSHLIALSSAIEQSSSPSRHTVKQRATPPPAPPKAPSNARSGRANIVETQATPPPIPSKAPSNTKPSRADTVETQATPPPIPSKAPSNTKPSRADTAETRTTPPPIPPAAKSKTEATTIYSVAGHGPPKITDSVSGHGPPKITYDDKSASLYYDDSSKARSGTPLLPEQRATQPMPFSDTYANKPRLPSDRDIANDESAFFTLPDSLASFRSQAGNPDSEQMRRYVAFRLRHAVSIWQTRCERNERYLWWPLVGEPWVVGTLAALYFIVGSLPIDHKIIALVCQCLAILAALSGAVMVFHRLATDWNGCKRKYSFRLEAMIKYALELERHLIRTPELSQEEMDKLYREIEVLYTVLRPDREKWP